MPHNAIESIALAVGSLQMSTNPVGNVECNSSSAPGTTRPPHHPSTKLYKYEGVSSGSHKDHFMKTAPSPTIVSKRSYKSSHHVTRKDGDSSKFNEGKEKSHSIGDGDKEMDDDNARKQVMINENNDSIQKPVEDAKNCESNDVLGSRNLASLPAQVQTKLGNSFCPSPQGSFYSATQYTEAKQSFTNTEVSECASSVGKSNESGEVSNSCDFVESRKTSINRGSTGSDVSDESSSSSFSSAMYKPHKANDSRWEAIQAVRSRNSGSLELKNFRIFKRLGCGDIGSVHLAELIGTRTLFAMKVMDKEALASRKKVLRAQTEREILQSLDHPFLPTLYTHFETEKFSFLVMEFCPGGDLHALRQKQPGKFFPEHAARSKLNSGFDV